MHPRGAPEGRSRSFQSRAQEWFIRPLLIVQAMYGVETNNYKRPSELSYLRIPSELFCNQFTHGRKHPIFTEEAIKYLPRLIPAHVRLPTPGGWICSMVPWSLLGFPSVCPIFRQCPAPTLRGDHFFLCPCWLLGMEPEGGGGVGKTHLVVSLKSLPPISKYRGGGA